MLWRNKKLKQAHEHLNNFMDELEKLRKRSYIIGIERKGRKNIFTFVRDGQLYKIETYNTISDDINGWRKTLIE